ncbi:MAG: 4-hydroxy-tetrahydrodipicolinate reductase [Pseudomonadota bacterium]
MGGPPGPNPAPLKVLLAGATGRMGRSILAAARQTSGDGASAGGAARAEAKPAETLEIIAGIASEPGEMDGLPVHRLADIGRVLPTADVVIDFSLPQVTPTVAAASADHGVAMVIGVTGFTAEADAKISKAAEHAAIVKARNMSLGVTVLAALVEKAAGALGPRYDIEIEETHHRRKVDAPSGTALMLGEAAAIGRGAPLDHVRAPADRSGARETGAVGFSVSRGGGVYGDHAVSFLGERETLTLSHRALDRALFADGALTAARWVARQAPGLYTMRDVLALD